MILLYDGTPLKKRGVEQLFQDEEEQWSIQYLVVISDRPTVCTGTDDFVLAGKDCMM